MSRSASSYDVSSAWNLTFGHDDDDDGAAAPPLPLPLPLPLPPPPSAAAADAADAALLGGVAAVAEESWRGEAA